MEWSATLPRRLRPSCGTQLNTPSYRYSEDHQRPAASGLTSDVGLKLLAPLRRGAPVCFSCIVCGADLAVNGHDPAVLSEQLEYLRRRATVS